MDFFNTYMNGPHRQSNPQDDLVQFFQTQYNKHFHQLSRWQVNFPLDLMYPLALAWMDSIEDPQAPKGLDISSNISEGFAPIPDRLSYIQDRYQSMRPGDMMLDISICRNTNKKLRDSQTACTMLDDRGWTIHPITPMLAVSKQHNVYVLVSPPDDNHGKVISILSMSDNTELMVRIAMLLPVLFGRKALSKPVEECLLLWLRTMQGTCNTYDLEAALKELPAFKEFEVGRREAKLREIILQVQEAQSKELRQTLERQRRDYQSTIRQASIYRTSIRDTEERLLVQSFGADKQAEAIKLAWEFWSRNNSIKRFEFSGSKLVFDIVTPLQNYDEAVFNAVCRRRYNEKDARLWKELMEGDTWYILSNATIHAPVFNGELKYYNLGTLPGLPNQHLLRYQCFGGHEDMIHKAADDMDLVRMTTAIIASVANINFRDTPVMEYYDDIVLSRGKEHHAVANRKTGEVLTFSDWRQRIREEDEAKAEAKRQTEIEARRQAAEAATAEAEGVAHETDQPFG